MHGSGPGASWRCHAHPQPPGQPVRCLTGRAGSTVCSRGNSASRQDVRHVGSSASSSSTAACTSSTQCQQLATRRPSCQQPPWRLSRWHGALPLRRGGACHAFNGAPRDPWRRNDDEEEEDDWAPRGTTSDAAASTSGGSGQRTTTAQGSTRAERLRRLMNNVATGGGYSYGAAQWTIGGLFGGLGSLLGASDSSSSSNGSGGGGRGSAPGKPRGGRAASPPQQQASSSRRSTGGSRGGPSANGAGGGTGASTSLYSMMPPSGEVGTWDDAVDDWDASKGLTEEQMETVALQGQERFRSKTAIDTQRDKWITPLLDFEAVRNAIDPDQDRSEEFQVGEALVNKDESQTSVRYVTQLLLVPLLTGFVISRILADPILNYTLKNNPDAFAMTVRQKIEGAEAVHVEETRLRMDMAIGRIPPLNESQMLSHLREFALEVQQEERQHNEESLITLVSDSVSALTLFGILSQPSRGRQALFNTLGRLFDGLSDIAKAVGIILVADTLLGYHSEEGWTGFIELVLGHYNIEAEEEIVLIFVGIIPVVIDVFFKYWIFIGLNKISPGAVVTIKQIDRH